MARYIVVFLQGAVLAFGALFLSVLAPSPFTEYGILTFPGKAQAAIVIMRLMPLQGATFLQMLPDLLWVPPTTVLLALPHGVGILRPIRWIGVAVNLAVFGYMFHSFPGLAEPQNMPPLLVLTAGLFLVSAILLGLIPIRPKSSNKASSMAVLLTVLLCVESISLLIYGAARASLAPMAYVGVAGSVMALVIAFYCLVKAIQVPGGQMGPMSSAAFLLVPLLIGLGLFFGGALPLALPVAAGVIVFFAVGMS